MKKQLVFFFCLIICYACSNGNRQSEKATITVTLEPLRYFTEAIAGDHFQVVSMVPEGSSPETYDPAPQQLVDLSKSQAYLRIGYIGFEQAWMDKLQTNAPHTKVFDTSRGVELIRGKGHRHGNHYHEGGVEPLIWNSTQNATVIVENVCAALCELDSTHRTEYRYRTDSLKQVFAQTDRDIRNLLQQADSAFMIYHPALSYFVRDYDLKQISIEEGGKEPSPAQLKHLIETCRNNNVNIIFVQQEFDQHNAQLIADELGIRIVPINPLSYHWQEEMMGIAKSLHKE